MKPRVFVGSSVESLSVAYAAQENLEHDAECTVWPQGIFVPSSTALDDLLATVHKSDFAMFVFTPDDVVKMRDQTIQAVRDNVIFELGLFTGHLGKFRNFVVRPAKIRDFHLPTDLSGQNLLNYDAERSDNNFKAALGPACNQVRIVMQKLGAIVPDSAPAKMPEAPVMLAYNDQDLLAILESWIGHRPSSKNTAVIHFAEVDKELIIPPGSAARLVEKAASRYNYVRAQRGEHTIRFDKSHPRPIALGSGFRFPGSW